MSVLKVAVFIVATICYYAMGIIVVFTLLIVMILVVLSRVSFGGREANGMEWRTCHVFL